jgi:tRNA 2-thiouridine synthesizing protein A
MNGLEPVDVDARGMRCPWPALRAARAMRTHHAALVRADDPIAGSELAALAQEHGWTFEKQADACFLLRRLPLADGAK